MEPHSFRLRGDWDSTAHWELRKARRRYLPSLSVPWSPFVHRPLERNERLLSWKRSYRRQLKWEGKKEETERWLSYVYTSLSQHGATSSWSFTKKTKKKRVYPGARDSTERSFYGTDVLGVYTGLRKETPHTSLVRCKRWRFSCLSPPPRCMCCLHHQRQIHTRKIYRILKKGMYQWGREMWYRDIEGEKGI